jgi:hypothetical protein
MAASMSKTARIISIRGRICILACLFLRSDTSITAVARKESTFPVSPKYVAVEIKAAVEVGAEVG